MSVKTAALPDSIVDHPAHRCALGVIDGSIPAGEWIVRAAKRYLADLENPVFRFSVNRAQYAIDWIQRLRQAKGKWAGRLLLLEPWQQFVVWNLFGFHVKNSDADGKEWIRRFRSAYVELPRKNGKSTFAAAIGLYMLCADGEAVAECYSAATTRDQAKIVWADAERMVAKSPELRAKIRKYTAHLEMADGSRFVPLASAVDNLDGLNVYFAVVDELHAHATGEVWEALETGMGTREEPLILATTTAGKYVSSFCYEQRKIGENILNRVVDDETAFIFIACPDEKERDDWQNPKVWRKANPNYGVSVRVDDLERLARKAEGSPTAKAAFLRLRLNIWTSAHGVWFSPDIWRRYAAPMPLSELVQYPCYGAFDLGTTRDLTAYAKIFDLLDGRFYLASRFYCASESLEVRAKRDHAPYTSWVQDGHMIATPGPITDHSFLQRDIEKDAECFDMRIIAFDPYNAGQIGAALSAQELLLYMHRQSHAAMNDPTKAFERALFGGKLLHDGNPVLAWCFANVVLSSDADEKVKPDKKKSREKIDGAVASVMAMGRADVADEEAESYYETGEIEVW